MLDMMIHDIDLVLDLANSPLQSVEAFGVSILGENEDCAQARLTFANGCIADLSANRVSPATRRAMQIWSEAGCVNVDFASREVIRHAPSERLLTGDSVLIVLGRPGAEIDRLKAEIFAEYLRVERPAVSAADALTAELSSFADCVTRRTTAACGRSGGPRRDASRGTRAAIGGCAPLERLSAGPGRPVCGPVLGEFVGSAIDAVRGLIARKFLRLVGVQQVEHAVFERVVDRDSVTGIDRGSAGPVEKMAAGLLQDGNERGGVPRIHQRIDHHVGAAGRDQRVPVAVAPPAGQFHGRSQFLKRLVAADPLKAADRRHAQQSVGKTQHARDVGRLLRTVAALPPGSLAHLRVDDFVQDREPADPQHEPFLELQADQACQTAERRE